MTLLSEKDMSGLMTDSTITYTASDGRQQQIVPIRQMVVTRPAVRHPPPPATPARPMALSHSTSSNPSISQAGTSVSMTTQLKHMTAPSLPHMRISNGGMRVPSVPVINVQSSPSAPSAVTQTNGNHDVKGHTDGAEQLAKSPAQLHSPHARQQASAVQQTADAPATNISPMRVKPQPPQAIAMPAVTNGYHISTVNAYSAIPNATYMHANNRPTALTLQQMQTMKSAYASMSPAPDTSAQANNPNLQLRTPAYLGHVIQNAHPNYAQFANVRHMQWATAAVAQHQHQQQRSPSANTAEVISAESMPPPAMSPPMPSIPVRTSSATGVRTPMSRNMAVPGAHLGQPPGRASPANPHMATRMVTPLTPSPHLLNTSLAATQVQGSPTRSPQPPMASPSLQARQVVGSSGAGY